METACFVGSQNLKLSLYLVLSVPTFQGLQEEILSKLADVMEEVSHWTVLYKTLCIFSEEPVNSQYFVILYNK